jgi:hypothetical protein
VIIGVRADGRKELVTLADGFRVDLAGEVAASLEPGVPPFLPTRAPACFPAGFPHRLQRLNLPGLLKATGNGRGHWHC